MGETRADHRPHPPAQLAGSLGCAPAPCQHCPGAVVRATGDGERVVDLQTRSPRIHPLMSRMLLLSALCGLVTVAGTGSTTVRHSVHLPGPPRAFRVIVLNTAAPNGLALNPAFTKLLAGSWTDAPSSLTPLLASGQENRGIEIAPAADKSINATFLYGDQAGSNATGAYALITAFALTPSYPNLIGVNVNSNIYEATISIANSIFGDGPATDYTFIITVAPPATFEEKL